MGDISLDNSILDDLTFEEIEKGYLEKSKEDVSIANMPKCMFPKYINRVCDSEHCRYYDVCTRRVQDKEKMRQDESELREYQLEQKKEKTTKLSRCRLNRKKYKVCNENCCYYEGCVLRIQKGEQDDCVSKMREDIDEKGRKGCDKKSISGDKTKQDISEWKDRINKMPEAEQIIHEGKIEYVLQSFNKLSSAERKKCINILKTTFENDFSIEKSEIKEAGFEQEKIVAMNEDEVNEFLTRNEKKLQENEKIWIYTLLIDKNAKNEKYFYERGECQYKLGDYENALKDINTAIDLNPDNAIYYARKGTFLNKKGDKEKALVEIKRAYAMEPQNKGVLVEYANYYTNNNELCKAIPLMEKYLAIQPDDDQALRCLLICLWNRNEYDKILQLTESDMKINPTGTVHFIRAVALAKKANINEAVKEVKKAVDLNPNNIAYQKYYGGLSMLNGSFEMDSDELKII